MAGNIGMNPQFSTENSGGRTYGRSLSENTGSASNQFRSDAEKSRLGRQFKVEKMDTLPYKEGDRVKHLKYGIGTVLSIQDGKRDFEVTVDFEQVGQKRMFASFAKLQKI
jgi:DNA helicase-2/ATP-dependent DNA helicase PcrA